MLQEKMFHPHKAHFFTRKYFIITYTPDLGVYGEIVNV